jgi:hypothetical protein
MTLLAALFCALVAAQVCGAALVALGAVIWRCLR